MSSITGQQRLFPASLEARLLGSLGRAGGFVLGATVAALWLSVITWSNGDPSLTHATGGVARNWLGGFGAVVSGLLETLGLATVVLLMAPMLWAIELVAVERVAGLRVKAAYFPISVLLVAGALSSLPVSAAWPFAHGYGGILGDIVLSFAARIIGVVNSDRAGAVAGLFYFITGLSALAQGCGLDAKTFSGLLPLSSTPTGAGIVTALVNSLRALPDKFATASTEWDREPAPRVRGRPAIEPRFNDWEPVPARMSQDFYQAGEEAGLDDQGAVIEDDLDGDFSSRAIAARFAPRQASRSTDDDGLPTPQAVVRDEGFDALTDAASRAIAERFAPRGKQGAPAAASTSAPLASSAPSPTVQSLKAQLLGAVPLRKADATYKRPSLNSLKRSTSAKQAPELSQTVMRGNARLLEDVLADYGVKGEVRDIKSGPVVTLFEVEPARGTKTARVVALADDIARSMNVRSVRIAVVPGRNAIGIELPNARRDAFSLREIFETEAWTSAEGTLPLALGKSITGEPVVADLARMPHLLIAGTTGSGKSVGLNAMIVSLLMRHSPEECRLLMIDPKMLELSVYNGIPHLLCPVVTEPQKAVAALGWAVNEMEERYKRMAQTGARNIEAFNARVRAASNRGETIVRTVQTGFDPHTGQAIYEREEIKLEAMPYIVVVVDEFADLMIASGKEIEGAVQRLAQKARAAGIHLVMATQRPSVDIVTGTIKANFPTRISFRVASKIDSRTILNEQGAEQLLGHGDMLCSLGAGQTVRVHGALVSDDEVESIAAHLRRQGGPRYIEGIGETLTAPGETSLSESGQQSGDALYDRAVAIVLCDRKASTSYIQRRLSIGYNRAADLIERMEQDGLVSAPNHMGRREILAGEPQAAQRSA